MNFASMIRAGIPTPHSTELASILEQAIAACQKAGYTVGSRQEYRHTDISTYDDIIVNTLKLKGATRGYDANIQVRIGISGVRVHHIAGFPPEVQAILLNLPSFADAGHDAKREQAHRQGDPDLESGCRQVASQGDKEVVSKGIKALLDIAALKSYNDERRRYIGASGIGIECRAYQSLSLRGFPSTTPDAKLTRIFRDGHRIEDMVVSDLVESGLKVEAVNPATGKQWRFTANDGHHIANLDGFVTVPGSPTMTLEIKSMNKDNFSKFSTHGIAKSHPKYYAQVQDGMMLCEMNGVNVESCLFVAYCKDNGTYEVEVVERDDKFIRDKVIPLVAAVMDGDAKRMSKYENAYDCKGCFKRDACWHPTQEMATSCSQCQHSRPHLNGKWKCDISQQEATAICPSFKLFRVQA